jgi:hypothetical protein
MRDIEDEFLLKNGWYKLDNGKYMNDKYSNSNLLCESFDGFDLSAAKYWCFRELDIKSTKNFHKNNCKKYFCFNKDDIDNCKKFSEFYLIKRDISRIYEHIEIIANSIEKLKEKIK